MLTWNAAPIINVIFVGSILKGGNTSILAGELETWKQNYFSGCVALKGLKKEKKDIA